MSAKCAMNEMYEDLLAQRGNFYKKTAIVSAVKMDCDFIVETLEGTMRAKAGDYLCRGIDGEFWPVAGHIFPRIYELVTSS